MGRGGPQSFKVIQAAEVGGGGWQENDPSGPVTPWVQSIISLVIRVSVWDRSGKRVGMVSGLDEVICMEQVCKS